MPARDGRGAALKFLETEYARAKDTELRCRIRKNVNLLSLEGQPAPEVKAADLKGRPAVLFFWAHWCGDCRAQAPILGRVLGKYRARGLAVIAPTRLFGTGAENKPAAPAEEKAHIEKVWKESYGMLDGVSAPIDTDTMVRWGVSSNPTLALVDRKGARPPLHPDADVRRGALRPHRGAAGGVMRPAYAGPSATRRSSSDQRA